MIWAGWFPHIAQGKGVSKIAIAVGMDVVLVVADPARQPSTPNTGRSPGSDAGEGVGTAVYGEGHSRPAQPHSRPSTAAGENPPRQDIPLIGCGVSSVCVAYRRMPECRSIG